MSSSASDSRSLRVVGLDVGTTTSSLLVASARLARNCVTGRSELGDVQPLFRPEPVFTPFSDEALAVDRLAAQLDRWIEEAALDPASVAAGGALVTGLAARAANAEAVTRLVKDRFPGSVVARADDPCLESWLAFMGNTLPLSRAEPRRAFINLDIGGGTTNVAWGLDGEVRSCGCYFVGARHIQVEPGSYRVRSLSPFARKLFSVLAVQAQIDDELPARDVERVLDFYVALLEAAVAGGPAAGPPATVREHCQVEFARPAGIPSAEEPVVTFSGGVGELIYRHSQGGELPGTTAFGDLGIDLARRLCLSPILGRNMASHVPAALGRATVQGLAVHSTEVSGTTVFLPDREVLPLTDLPILGRVVPAMSDSELASLVDLAARAAAGACLRVEPGGTDMASIKTLGKRLAALLASKPFPATRPLVLLTAGNIGKTLGQYASDWGRLATSLVVVDEVPARPAHFATIGKPCDNVLPVAFHGWDSEMKP